MGGGRRRGEAGTGIIGTMLGAAAFLALLLFAVQVLVGLYLRSMVGAATYDAAKAVAGADGGLTAAAMGDAEANARSQLGAYGGRVTFDWSRSDASVVRLTTTGPRLSFLPAALTGPVGLGDVRRTVTVRLEAVR